MVFFEASRRVGEVLSDMAEVWGESRSAAVCRELTKTYEEVKRGSLAELAEWSDGGLRGEVTLVVAGAPDVVELPDDELKQRVRAFEETGMSRRDAVDAVVAETGIARRRVYALANT